MKSKPIDISLLDSAYLLETRTLRKARVPFEVLTPRYKRASTRPLDDLEKEVDPACGPLDQLSPTLQTTNFRRHGFVICNNCEVAENWLAKLEPELLHMKILVSAIACNPIIGSEAYFGWSAVCALSRNHELWVIINNLAKEGTQAAVAKGEVPANIHFIYHGRSEEEYDGIFLRPWNPNRLIARLANWLNYLEWNDGLLELARKLHAQIGFDLVHHVTYATWRVGSPLVCLGVPFVWGPIGGGENMPLPFMSMLSAEGAAFELIPKSV